MRRGEIWWANFPEPIGRRPVLLLTRDAAYRVRAQVTVAEVTSAIYHIPVEVPLGPQDGLPKAGVVNLDTLMTIPKVALTDRICELTPRRMEAVHRAIKFALDLP